MIRIATVLALIAFTAVAQAQVKQEPERLDVPSRAVPGTHSCDGYYPEAERRASRTGTVQVVYDVAADGTATNVRVLKSSGNPQLDAAALRCVAQAWRNTPAIHDGKPVVSPNHKAAIAFRLVEGDEPSGAPTAGPAQAGGAVPAGNQARADKPVPGTGDDDEFRTLLWSFAALGIAAVAIVLAVALFSSRRRSVVSGPVVCGHCGVVNIVPARSFRRPRCSACGEKFNI